MVGLVRVYVRLLCCRTWSRSKDPKTRKEEPVEKEIHSDFLRLSNNAFLRKEPFSNE